MAKLTKAALEGAENRPKSYFIWCSELPGFGARILPGGRRSFYVDYYNRDGQRKRMSIGPYGKLTVDEARRLARITLGGVLGGEDPALERKTRRSSLTVADLCDQYVKAANAGLIIGRSGRPKKMSTMATDTGRIEQHIKPLLGRKLVIDLKRPDIAKFIRDVTAGKTSRIVKSPKPRGKSVVKGGAGTATRTAGLLSGILSYAVSEGVIEHNPAHGVPRPSGNVRRRRLSPEEYRALGTALEQSSAAWQPKAALRLLALTGCRRGEIEQLQWSAVDLEARLLRLDDTKSGYSIRPLSLEALQVLETLPFTKRTGYVLQSDRDPKKPFGGLPKAIRGLFERAKVPGATPHTLRHSFASVAADMDYSDSTIGDLLGHATSSVTSRYMHRADSVLLAAADKIAAEVHRQMKEGSGESSCGSGG